MSNVPHAPHLKPENPNQNPINYPAIPSNSTNLGNNIYPPQTIEREDRTLITSPTNRQLTRPQTSNHPNPLYPHHQVPIENRVSNSPYLINQTDFQGNNTASRQRMQNDPNLQNSHQSRSNQIPINQNQNNNQSNIREVAEPYRSVLSSSQMGKMDGVFAQSFKSVRCQHIASAIIVFILLTGVLLLYRFKVFKGVAGQQFGFNSEEGQSKLSLLSFITIFQCLILFSKVYFYLTAYASLNFALSTANKFGNGSNQEPGNLTHSFNQNISSQYLLVETMTTFQQGMESSLKNIYLDQTKNKIRRAIRNQDCCAYQLTQMMEFGMFICAILLIVALAQDRTTWIQKVILISTTVYWMLQNYRTVLYLIVLLLCPLITLGVLIYACCCSSGRNNFVIPQSIKPTNEQIMNTGGSCSICMMDFETSQNVVILPCSDKHMFHQLCIQGWLKVKSTCPMCRHDMSTNSA